MTQCWYVKLVIKHVQMANKKFKTTIEESAGSLREEVKAIRGHQRSPAPSKEGKGAPPEDEEKSPEEQVQEMRNLLKVKDQMVWMMLEERGQLQSSLTDKDSTIKALEVMVKDGGLALTSCSSGGAGRVEAHL